MTSWCCPLTQVVKWGSLPDFQAAELSAGYRYTTSPFCPVTIRRHSYCILVCAMASRPQATVSAGGNVCGGAKVELLGTRVDRKAHTLQTTIQPQKTGQVTPVFGLVRLRDKGCRLDGHVLPYVGK